MYNSPERANAAIEELRRNVYHHFNDICVVDRSADPNARPGSAKRRAI
jgi:hypothetical protein